MLKQEYTIGIVGCGKMGTNLFHFLAGFPFSLVLICKSPGASEKIRQTFKRKLERSLKHGLTDRVTYDYRLSNTIISQSLKDLKDCDLVIESISENLEFKKELFQNLDQIVSETCILASNSSSFSPEDLIPHERRKHNTIGLHFFYPVALTDLAEVNTLNTTSPETIAFIKSFLNRINKFYLVFSETANFTINKMFLKLQAGCCLLHQQYGLSYARIDTIIKETLFPVGVFEFFDHVGIDTMHAAVTNYLKNFAGEQFYYPLIDELETLYKQGKLGKKSGEGFYQYQNTITPDSLHGKDLQQEILTGEIKNMLYQWYLEPVYQVVSNNICTKAEIDHIVKEYMNASQSPFVLAQHTGYKFPD